MQIVAFLTVVEYRGQEVEDINNKYGYGLDIPNLVNWTLNR